MGLDIKEEYGGCLYFEYRKGMKCFYDEFENIKIDVDSGRSALQYILENYKFKRIWLPIYNCPLVAARIISVSTIKICWYNLNESFRPMINKNKFIEGDILLWVNYFGVMSKALIDEIVSLQINTPVKIIIDNIPAYFSQPIPSVFNIYSCRKFIGVPDGGHVIGNSVKQIELPIYTTANNYLYLLKAIETGSNSAYSGYKESEKRFNDSRTVYAMPILTKKILTSLDYNEIIDYRKINFNVLHSILGQSNRLAMNILTNTPSVYPYLTSNKELRQKLLDNHIYISRFWKHVLVNEFSNNFEKDLAEYLIPLPIDQRYDPDDMQFIANMVMRLEKK